VGTAVGLGDVFSNWDGPAFAPQRRRGMLLTGALALLATLATANYELATWRQVEPALEAGGYLTYSYRDLGLWLQKNTPPESSVAVSDIGAIGYFSERRIIDMFGLIDTHLARVGGKQHHKTDPDYVLARNPDYVVLVRTEGQSGGYLRLPDAALGRQPAFRSSYRLIREFPMPGAGEKLEVFEMKLERPN